MQVIRGAQICAAKCSQHVSNQNTTTSECQCEWQTIMGFIVRLRIHIKLQVHLVHVGGITPDTPLIQVRINPRVYSFSVKCCYKRGPDWPILKHQAVQIVKLLNFMYNKGQYLQRGSLIVVTAIVISFFLETKSTEKDLAK